MVKDRKRKSDVLATEISEGKIQMNGTGHSTRKSFLETRSKGLKLHIKRP